MRTVLAALALLLAGCTHVNQFRPARADQAVAEEPAAAFTQGGGVRAWVRAGDWRGWPEDLEDRVTPVEILLENQGPAPLAIRPSLFTLRTPGGFRAQALEPVEVQRLVASVWSAHAAVFVHPGFYGYYPWPGYPVRPYRGYPYAWWGYEPFFPWGPPVAVVQPVPAAPPSGPPPVAAGTLERAGRVSLLLIFPVPASQLAAFDVVVELVTPAGEPLGTLEVAMVRADS